MTGGIAEPALALFVGFKVLAHRVLTYVTNAVVINVYVSRFISAGYAMAAGGSVPVLGFVLGPGLRILVNVTAVIAADVAASVVVVILVSKTLKVFVTNIALEVLVCVHVVLALYRCAALVTLEVLVSIGVLSLGTSKLRGAAVTDIIVVLVDVTVTVYISLTLFVAYVVVIFVRVIITRDEFIASVTIVVFVSVNVSLAGNCNSAFVTTVVVIIVYVFLANHLGSALVTLVNAVRGSVDVITFDFLVTVVAEHVSVGIDVLGAAGKCGA